jgi:HAD superfamily hydrolase (TIGR01509 family)
MSTTAEAKSPSSRNAGTPPPAALLFELEGVALPVRPVLFEAARARHSALNHAVFSRCTGPISTLSAQLYQALGKTGSDGDLAAALNNAVTERLSANKLTLNAGLEKLLKAAAQRGIPAAALTGLPESVAQAAFAATGLESRGIQLFVFSDEEKLFPRADAWLKAAKQLGKTPRFCVALGSSQSACKTALSAGMRTVAVPDAFTGHHDFGGADMIIDSWDDVSASGLLDDLIPMLR